MLISNRFWIVFAVALLSGACAIAQTSNNRPRRALKRERDVELPLRPLDAKTPVWRGGHLLTYTHNLTAGPIIRILGRDGQETQLTFRIPEAAAISISKVTASPEGELAVIGGAATSGWHGTTFLARISADRQSQTITRLHPYGPGAVTFAADGTIWTLGHLTDDARTRDVAYHVIRRFDRAGRMLSSQSVSLAGSPGLDEVAAMQPSRDRVGLFTAHGEYVEFSLNGTEIGRYDGPGGIRADRRSGSDYTMALSEDNDVVVSRSSPPEFPKVWTLDRIKREWVQVSVDEQDFPKGTRVLGFDKASLVVLVEPERLRLFSMGQACQHSR